MEEIGNPTGKAVKKSLAPTFGMQLRSRGAKAVSDEGQILPTIDNMKSTCFTAKEYDSDGSHSGGKDMKSKCVDVFSYLIFNPAK